MSSKAETVRVHAALVSVQVLFGLWPVAGAEVLKLMSPPALVGFRLLFGAPLLAFGAGLLWRKLPSRSDLVKLALLGAAGIGVNQLLFAEGLARAGPINASLAGLLIPALTLVFASLARHEKPGPGRVFGVALSFAGAAILMRIERFDFGDRLTIGNLFLLGNVSAYSIYMVGARPVLARLGSIRTMGWVFVFGAIEALPVTVPAVIRTGWLTLPGWAYGTLAFILIGATLLTYLLNVYALKRVESSLVAVYVYIQPIVAVGTVWWLGTRPTLRTLVAAVVIVAGVVLSTRSRNPAKSVPQRPFVS